MLPTALHAAALTAAALLFQDAAPPSAPDTPQVDAQDAAQEAGQDTGPEWQLVDGVAGIVNTDMFTWSDVSREMELARTRVTVTTAEEHQQLLADVMTKLVRDLLWTQGGSELGVDPQQIQSSIDRLIEERQEQEGTQGRAQYLQDQGLTRKGERRFIEGEIQRRLWINYATGRGPGSGGRPTLDTWMRPGRLYGIWRDNEGAFGTPDQVQLQVLVVLSRALGGDEAAREHAEGLREQALAGADFDQLVLENGAVERDTLGRLEPQPVPGLGDPVLRRFAASAPPGDVSPVLPYAEDGQLAGYQIFKLLERIEGPPPPPFTDRQVQGQVRDLAERRLQDILLGRAHDRLQRNSYIWPEPRR